MNQPIDTDPQADTAELLARAARDYADAETRRQDLDHEDRVHGNEIGGH